MDRIVKISYTGRIKGGIIFDTTDEKVAKSEDVVVKGKVYKPLPIAVGEGHLLEALDGFLKDMKVGEEKKIELPPEKAFGQRDPNMVRLVPMKIFKDQKMTPIPGMPIQLDGRNARIQTVAGGRVRVDFNSDLAGRTVVYDIKIEEEAKTEKDKVLFLIERSFNTNENFKVSVEGKKLSLEIPEAAYKDRELLIRKASFAAEMFKILGIEEISYVEKWVNKKADKKKAETKENKTEKNPAGHPKDEEEAKKQEKKTEPAGRPAGREKIEK